MTDDHDPKRGDKSKVQAPEGERIAKVMARAGLCSRRDAEAWIAAGRVSVNGKKLSSPAVNVGPNDLVRVDGKLLPEAEKTRLFRYHKPRGLVTTAKDPEGRPTVFDNLPEGLPRVISVGRLDLNSEGLLLLTNDGELARRLELPATGWVRRYRVRVNGRIDPASLTRLAQGLEIDGVRYGAIEAVLDRQQGDNAWLTMSLTEGKNREIRKVCAHFGWTVSRLIRLSYGPFQLGHLDKGQIEEVPGKVLRDQLGQPGTAQPLRPHQASGGKARPPKSKPGQHRSAEPQDERDQRVYRKPDQDNHSRDKHSQGKRDQRRGYKHVAEGRAHQAATARPPEDTTAARRHQPAEALAASLRSALDRASREERAEELQQRQGRTLPTKLRSDGLRDNKTDHRARNERTTARGKPHQGKPVMPKSGSKNAGPTGNAGKRDTERPGSRPGSAKSKHAAHRQRRP